MFGTWYMCVCLYVSNSLGLPMYACMQLMYLACPYRSLRFALHHRGCWQNQTFLLGSAACSELEFLLFNRVVGPVRMDCFSRTHPYVQSSTSHYLHPSPGE